jgi:hypothetical protein
MLRLGAVFAGRALTIVSSASPRNRSTPGAYWTQSLLALAASQVFSCMPKVVSAVGLPSAKTLA